MLFQHVSCVVLGCSVVRQLWGFAKVNEPVTGFSSSTQENIEYLLSMIEADGPHVKMRRSIPWVLWTIWKNRNSILYGEKRDDPVVLIEMVWEKAELWFRVNDNTSSASLSRRFSGLSTEKKWKRPTLGWIKCNVH